MVYIFTLRQRSSYCKFLVLVDFVFNVAMASYKSSPSLLFTMHYALQQVIVETHCLNSVPSE